MGSPVPATVNAGRPPRDICLEAAVDERRCICINTGRGRSETGYEPICGNCRDPCQLKFTPDIVPAYLQRLAVEDLEEDKDDKNKKRNKKLFENLNLVERNKVLQEGRKCPHYL